MTSTSSDRVVLRDVPGETVAPAPLAADLRSGEWTRLGSTAVLGDSATEASLQGLAERSGRAARAQGYAAGWAEGRRAGLARAAEEAVAGTERLAQQQERHRAEHAQALRALDVAVEQMQDAVAETVSQLSGQAVEMALQIAAAVIGREVATAVDPGADAVRRALADVSPAKAVTVWLHPEDRAALDLTVLEGRDVVVLDDLTLSRGDAVVETDENLVDATLGTALARVREVLAP